MKKNIYILFTVITAMLSLGVFSSCEQLKQPEGENTEDTGKIDEQYDLAPGTVITYEFTPSSVWTISISEESYKWFKIKDGKFNVASLTGRSSAEPVTITIETASDEVAQLCPTLCDPMNRSTPGLPVHHQLPESAQTHVHRVGDAIQPSHPLLALLLLPSVFPSIRVKPVSI